MVETADFLLSFPFVFCLFYAHNLTFTSKLKRFNSYIRVFTPYIIPCYRLSETQLQTSEKWATYYHTKAILPHIHKTKGENISQYQISTAHLQIGQSRRPKSRHLSELQAPSPSSKLQVNKINESYQAIESAFSGTSDDLCQRDSLVYYK